MGLRDAAILNLAARTGVRACEISRAYVSDLQQRGDVHILLVQGKGKLEKDDWVVVGDDCYLFLQRYLAQRGQMKATDPLFDATSDGCFGARLGTTTLRKIAKLYLRKNGHQTNRTSLHSFRHSCVSLSITAGASLLECKTMSRHEAVGTTMRYLHQNQRLKTAAELKLEKLLRGEAPPKQE